jgi:hypothetical protein
MHVFAPVFDFTRVRVCNCGCKLKEARLSGIAMEGM